MKNVEIENGKDKAALGVFLVVAFFVILAVL